MKRIYLFLLVLSLLLSVFPACGKDTVQSGEGAAPAKDGIAAGDVLPVETESPTVEPKPIPPETPAPAVTFIPVETAPKIEQKDGSAIFRLDPVRWSTELNAQESIKPYGTYWFELTQIKANLSGSPGLTYSLTIGDNTAFKGNLPQGYDPAALIEWGKNPGLNVDILHAYGFTGKGTVIAYIDQALAPHEEYDRENIHVINTGKETNSMHGAGALSLLAGKTIGIVPEAEVYYFGCDSGNDAQLYMANALYDVIALNETLPEGEKITMVGFSDNIDFSEDHAVEFRAAVKACESAGIMVWFCWEYGAATFLPGADKNFPYNLMADQWGGGQPDPLVYIPASGRTVACTVGSAHYVYYSTAGLSWTMPYALGLYAIALSIDPSLTKDELRMKLKSTALFVNGGLSLVDPVGFVSTILEQAGRKHEAATLREEVKNRLKCLWAVVNTETMSPEDLHAVYNSLAWFTDGQVLVADASSFPDSASIMAVIQNILDQNPGVMLSGIQIFGSETTIPPLPGEEEGEKTNIFRLSLGPGEYVTFFRDYLTAVRNGDLDSLEDFCGHFFTPNYAGMTVSDAEGKIYKP